MAKRLSITRLLRSTPLRQAFVLTAIFALMYTIALGGSYVKMRQDLRLSLRSQMTQQLDELDVSATPRAMAAIVAAKAEAMNPRETAIVFLGKDGTQVGNARARPIHGQLVLHPRGRRRLAGGYMQETRRISGGVVLVAMALTPLEDLRRTFGELLWLTLLPTAGLSLSVAAWLARRAAHRVDAIEATLGKLADSQYQARVENDGPRDDDLGRIAQRLNHMASRHQETLAALRQVSTDIAHDLRTPLQRLSVHLEQLSDTLPDDGPAATLVQAARDEADRSVAIFRGLLQIARIEGGEVELERSEVDLRDIATQVFELYQAVAEDSGHDLHYSPPTAPCPVHGNRDLLTQAIVNLVENALRHTPTGSTLHLMVAPNCIGLRDNGPGIPEAQRSLVTRRLYRLEASRSTAGHGLGLALVEAIVQAHGADLCLAASDQIKNLGLDVQIRFPQISTISHTAPSTAPV